MIGSQVASKRSPFFALLIGVFFAAPFL